MPAPADIYDAARRLRDLADALDDLGSAGRDDIADMLDAVATATGHNQVRHAARVVRARCGGRPAIDDAFALAEVRDLVDAKRVAYRWHGCKTVARRLAPSRSRERVIANRLLRKLTAEDSASKRI